MSAIKIWAENMSKEIYSEYKDKYSFWKYGIKVFYSPVVINPELLIISYQPGGTEKNFEEEDKIPFEKGDFHIQDFNSYIEINNNMGRKVISFFNFNSGLNLLENSVIFPLIFFRAPSISLWRKEIPKPTRIKMENYSYLKAKEIINKLSPQRILVLGMETYNRLKDILGTVENEETLYTRNIQGERMAVRAVCGGYKIFAIIHPTGARINKKDWNSLKDLFETEIQNK